MTLGTTVPESVVYVVFVLRSRSRTCVTYSSPWYCSLIAGHRSSKSLEYGSSASSFCTASSSSAVQEARIGPIVAGLQHRRTGLQLLPLPCNVRLLPCMFMVIPDGSSYLSQVPLPLRRNDDGTLG